MILRGSLTRLSSITTSLPQRSAHAGLVSTLICSAALATACIGPATRSSTTGTGGAPAGGSTGGSGAVTGGTGGTTSGTTGGSGPSSTGGTAAGGSGGSGEPSTGGSSGGGSPDAGGAASDGSVAAVDGSSGGGGTTSCVGFTGKFCDDFEGTPAAGAYTLGRGITLDTTKAHSGTKSMHFKPTGTSYMSFSKGFPFNEMHGRLMMFMDKTPTTSSHWNFLISDNSGGTQWSIGGQYGNFELVCDPPDNGIDSKTKFPEGKWVCLQWTFKFEPAGGKTTFLTQIDGVTVDGGSVMGPKGNDWKGGPWKDLQIGWEIFGSGGPPEFWIDDLAFGEQPIACP
jgi:hypothetical protein